MQNSCNIPVTAKTRIGFDDVEEFDYLNKFVNKIKNAGCKTIILHARKAVLKGLTPKQNLNIPKLNYQMVIIRNILLFKSNSKTGENYYLKTIENLDVFIIGSH